MDHGMLNLAQIFSRRDKKTSEKKIRLTVREAGDWTIYDRSDDQSSPPARPVLQDEDALQDVLGEIDQPDSGTHEQESKDGQMPTQPVKQEEEPYKNTMDKSTQSMEDPETQMPENSQAEPETEEETLQHAKNMSTACVGTDTAGSTLNLELPSARNAGTTDTLVAHPANDEVRGDELVDRLISDCDAHPAGESDSTAGEQRQAIVKVNSSEEHSTTTETRLGPDHHHDDCVGARQVRVLQTKCETLEKTVEDLKEQVYRLSNRQMDTSEELCLPAPITSQKGVLWIVPDLIYADERVSGPLHQLASWVHGDLKLKALPSSSITVSHAGNVILPVIAASRVGSDLLAAFHKAKLRVPAVVLIFHHNAPHMSRIRTSTKDRLSDRQLVDSCQDMVDLVFWNGNMYDCETNTKAVQILKDIWSIR